jgi:hypothetical protein
LRGSPSNLDKFEKRKQNPEREEKNSIKSSRNIFSLFVHTSQCSDHVETSCFCFPLSELDLLGNRDRDSEMEHYDRDNHIIN